MGISEVVLLAMMGHMVVLDTALGTLMELVLQQNRLRWYGHVLRKEDDDWVKKCVEYEVEGPRPRGRPIRTWTEVVREDCQARKMNRCTRGLSST